MKGLFLPCVVLFGAGIASGAGINYHENWDSYAAGETDPTYTSIWNNDDNVSPSYPEVWVTKSFSAPNSLGVLQQNRGIDNSLVDGIGPGEMSAGQTVNGQGLPTDATGLDLGVYIHNSAGGSRQNTSQYVEISLGGVHAPDPSNFASYGLAGALDPLPAPIPVLAIGKLNGLWSTGDGTTTGQRNTIYFFNGQQWINTFMAMGAATNGFNRVWAYIGESLVDSEVQGAGSGANAGIARAYLGGFDTISYRYFNGGQSISGTAATDDLWLSGGVIVPEPAALILLLTTPLFLRSRKRAR